MTRLVANLLIVAAFVLLGLAYRLKRNEHQVTQKKPGRRSRRRPGPGRIERLFLELSIIFSAARFGLIGA